MRVKILILSLTMLIILTVPRLLGADEFVNPGGMNVTEKTVEDMLIAGIRYRGQFEETPTYFLKLFAHAGSYITGPPFALYYDAGTEEGFDIEVCVPVSDTVETTEIKTRLYEGGELLSAFHYGDGETLYGQNLSKAWDRLFEYVGMNDLKVTAPIREIHLEWNMIDSPQDVIEMQIPLIDG
ncbi:GyrI-like domain-containing protein [candidate division WOR-3 bacterium]|nr:GyrI-like domain-containing protein [candidate division WOR-3 bacterium]